MDSAVLVFIIGQAITIVVGLVGIYVKLNNKLTELQGDVRHIHADFKKADENHEKLEDRVQGISRVVERHDAILDTAAGARR